ncbi:MAG: A/G-specific adenine glycosylase [Acidimicrobiales bacterium]
MAAPTPSLHSTILPWADQHLRDLPWRRTRDPWAVLVAETMLQQTQVARVVDRWERFLQRFPDPRSCADAPPADLLREWAGLGYNRRALMLHRTATTIRDDHDGAVPSELAALTALPGIGPYTARAVRAFAFELGAAPVDTNIGRVLARVGGQRLGAAAAQRLADSLVPDDAVWRWNQGIMELGARICTKRAPSCRECPVVEHCRWRGMGPDPADGSAAVGRPQAAFAGSDRQLRGRVINALRAGRCSVREIDEVLSIDDEARRGRILDGLVGEGLVEREGDRLCLPGDRQDGPVSAERSASIA